MRATFVALFMVLATHVSAQEAQGVATDGPAVGKQAPGNADAGEGNASKSALPITIIESPDQANHATERETKADKHDAEDLDAQQKAADAAEVSATAAQRQVIPTYAQAILGALGMVLLFAAFLYTKWTYDHSVSSSERQLRAYVCLEGVHAPAGFEADEITAVAHVKNFGATPASEMSQWTLIKLREYPLVGDLEPYDDSGHPNRVILPPGAITLSMPTFRGLEAWEITAIKKEELALYVYGEINYIDAFGENRSTIFRMRSTGEQSFKLGVFKATKDGNGYT
ncbi:hypothetical protein EOD08_11200 [Mesorhizobium sp. M6A.T.Ca.TU.002.02.2.1]|nr:hypothetical protein EOD08_11200 [Mesorhizobium sp. M6A.T.Ca.TU.002.02.2.1]